MVFSLPFCIIQPPSSPLTLTLSGGPQEFKTFREVKEAFARTDGNALDSGDLKAGISELLIEFLTPLREKVYANYDLCMKAYPDSRPLSVIKAAGTKGGKPAPAPKKGKAPARMYYYSESSSLVAPNNHPG